jgi:hypothetical protein
MGILEMDFKRILGVPFFCNNSSHSIMLCMPIRVKLGVVQLFKGIEPKNITKAYCIFPFVEKKKRLLYDVFIKKS